MCSEARQNPNINSSKTGAQQRQMCSGVVVQLSKTQPHSGVNRQGYLKIYLRTILFKVGKSPPSYNKLVTVSTLFSRLVGG